MIDLISSIRALLQNFEGDISTDNISRILYATDASAYREIPLAVARPKTIPDIKLLIDFANHHKTTLIPRTAGTSLAGQVVGNGIIVDVSKHFTNILEINKDEHWVRVQPGVVLDELNQVLESYGLFFGPETSTSNRCMMGGMVSNNSCGSHSIIYGSTRDHTLEVKALLTDGNEVIFNSLNRTEFDQKCNLQTLEGQIYRNIREILKNPGNQEEIRKQFPDPLLKRRNNGYAIDLLLESEPFTDSITPFNFCRLISGSEGTLCIITEIKLNLVPLPPKIKGVICVHLQSIEDAIHANLIALKYKPGAVELMDNVILQLTKENITQQRNRSFIQGDPGAILIVEFARETREEINELYEKLVTELKTDGYGYHFPLLFNEDIHKVWALRKSGLGILSNMPGDAKPVSVIEDTAVNPEFLEGYICDFKQILQQYHLSCVYHAHIGSGELHLRPVLNLKDPKDVELFHTIAYEMAKLVKKYRGSLSGEHGDGRLRGEFIPLMIGEHNYNLLKDIKRTWDPHNIFNTRKITDVPPMNAQLRFDPYKKTREIKTYFDFSKTQGILRAAENCNGSGDCRKSQLMGGTMCPSYMATRDEFTTTRARANVLREFLTQSSKQNPFDHKEIYDVMDLCLSCKACKSECPSNVDMAKLKAEFLQHYYEANGVPFRTLAIAYINKINSWMALMPGIYNSFISNTYTSALIKKILGFAIKRTIPKLGKQTLLKWARKNLPELNSALSTKHRKIWLFADEFTNYNDVEIGIISIKLLHKLGYCIEIPKHLESGRTFLSKGLVRKAKAIANQNVSLLNKVVHSEMPLIGIEPSCILTFRDEYPDLVDQSSQASSIHLAKNTFIIDDFLAREIENGNIKAESFTDLNLEIILHGHCQQKALISTASTKTVLSLPINYKVTEIKSGCCGMAGSFGYEKEHYDISMKIGELVLFPEVRKAKENVVIAAPGTSCRHHIKDGTGKIALHPVEILWKALK